MSSSVWDYFYLPNYDVFVLPMVFFAVWNELEIQNSKLLYCKENETENRSVVKCLVVRWTAADLNERIALTCHREHDLEFSQLTTVESFQFRSVLGFTKQIYKTDSNTHWNPCVASNSLSKNIQFICFQKCSDSYRHSIVVVVVSRTSKKSWSNIRRINGWSPWVGRLAFRYNFVWLILACSWIDVFEISQTLYIKKIAHRANILQAMRVVFVVLCFWFFCRSFKRLYIQHAKFLGCT